MGFFTSGRLRNFTVPILLMALQARDSKQVSQTYLTMESFSPESTVLTNCPSAYIWEMSYYMPSRALYCSSTLYAWIKFLSQISASLCSNTAVLCASCLLGFPFSSSYTSASFGADYNLKDPEYMACLQNHASHQHFGGHQCPE